MMDVKSRTLRNTHQRQLVLDIVRSSFDHPTAGEIYERARLQDSTISKGTVYRNLKLLSELGEIRKLEMPFGSDHYDFNLENHYHFLCRQCNKTVDLSIDYRKELNEVPPPAPGYLIEQHRLLLVGLCSDCKP